MNIRRKLLVALGAGVLTAPLVSFAQQQGKVWRIGFLSPRHRPISLEAEYFGAFLQGMRELGYVESKNLTIEWRFGDDQYERLPALAAELVRLKVDVIVAAGTPAVSAAQKATTTIPIVMGNSSNPVASGFVASLARPEGNITGLSSLGEDIHAKLLEMLLSIVPRLTRLAFMVNPGNSMVATILKNIQAAAQKTGVKILLVEAQTPQEIEKAFSTMTHQKAGAVVIADDVFFTQQRLQIAKLAVRHRLPSIYPREEYAQAGGLMTYGSSLAHQYRRAATYVDKILKGAKPADLPVEQPTKFELVINGKTAKALGLTIPQSLLMSADKVIE